MESVTVTVQWQVNPRQEGVMATYADGRLIFPSYVGLVPEDRFASVREVTPVAGQTEKVRLVLSPNGKVWHAYPVFTADALMEAPEGVIQIDGHLIVLRNDNFRVTSARFEGGQLIITIE